MEFGPWPLSTRTGVGVEAGDDTGRPEKGGGPVGRQPHCASPFKESSG